MDGRDDDGIASGCPGATPTRHRKSTKGFSHAASNPNPTCRVGGRKKKDTTLSQRAQRVGLSLLVPKGSEAVTTACPKGVRGSDCYV